MAFALIDVLANPGKAAEYLRETSAVYGVDAAAGRVCADGAAILELTLRPLPALAGAGYPVEKVRVVIRPDHSVLAFPRGAPGRRFLHRNMSPSTELCLQYEQDDPRLRWLPEDGLDPLITMIHRHLMFEEHWRRTGSWPTEDAPHGPAPVGTAHPITKQLAKELRRWER